MSTVIRPENSKKSPYYLEKHRYYELKHFCLQYKNWKKQLAEVTGLQTMAPVHVTGGDRLSPTEYAMLIREKHLWKVLVVENTALSVGEELSKWLMLGVTEGCTYETLRTRWEIPCCRETYYKVYRRFFKELSDRCDRIGR